LAEYRDRFSELSSLGLGLAALSVDEPKRSSALAAQLHLPFTLLCDPGREIVRLYGLFNEKEKGGIAYPATFVLDRGRTVRFRSLDRTAARVDLDGLFSFLRLGIASAPPVTPARSRIVPGVREWIRVTGNAIRYGIRSPRRR
jgi:peroxiredoxin